MGDGGRSLRRLAGRSCMFRRATLLGSVNGGVAGVLLLVSRGMMS